MRPRPVLIFALCLMILPASAAPAYGGPGVEITSPADSSVLLSRTLNVTGTATGTDAQWSQTSRADFSAGTASGVSVNQNGTVSLGSAVYDDFDDNSIDPDRWTRQTTAGLTLAEENGMHKVYGNPATMAWTGAGIRSTLSVNEVSADLLGFTGSGNSWGTSLGLWQDDQNSIVIAEHYDWTWGYKRLAVAWVLGGSSNELFFGNLDNNPAPHNFRASYSGGTITFYMDNSSVYSRAVSFASPVIALWTSAVDKSYVSSQWDTVVVPAMDGNLTSSVLDTGCSLPVLNNVSWASKLGAGSGLDMYLRSAGRSDMSDASGWVQVQNGQSSGLPAARRYIQYRANLHRTDQLSVALLEEVGLGYHRPVAKVEVSVDGMASWLPATGRTSWWALCSVPENASLIHARVTDAAGEVRITSVNIQVDTTPPEGSVLINEGDRATFSPDVSLRLEAFDRFGVASMKLGESPDLEGAQWRPYAPRLDWTLSGGDGQKTVYARYRDANGWESALVCDTILLDAGPVSGSVVVNGGALYSNSTSVRLGLAAEDHFEIVEMRLSGRGDFPDAPWTAFAEAADWTLEPGNGERRVFAMFRNSLGQESAAASDTILLDTAPPAGNITLDGGALYTRTRSVAVALAASDNYGVASMELSESPDLAGAVMRPFSTGLDLPLSAGEGPRTVYARFWDAAGNPGSVASATIILDGTPPATTTAPLPGESARADLTVSWSGSDAASGVLWYDVEYRVGEGPWTAWLSRVNSTSAVFQGQDGRSYSFRSRAQDRAGNLEPFGAAAAGPVLVDIPAPVATISEPFANAAVKGRLAVRGTAYHPDPNRSVARVLVRLDDGEWELANGTGAWSFDIDTKGLQNGPHTVRAKASDGLKDSAEAERTFVVKNPKAEPSLTVQDNLPLILVLVVILAGAGICIAYWLGRKRGGPEGGPPGP